MKHTIPLIALLAATPALAHDAAHLDPVSHAVAHAMSPLAAGLALGALIMVALASSARGHRSTLRVRARRPD